MNQFNTLYNLNLNNIICQLYLLKSKKLEITVAALWRKTIRGKKVQQREQLVGCFHIPVGRLRLGLGDAHETDLKWLDPE